MKCRSGADNPRKIGGDNYSDTRGNARAGLLAQPLGQQHGAPVQTRVTQINRLEFLFRPAHPLAPLITPLPMLRTCV